MRIDIAARELWGKYGLWCAVCVAVELLLPQPPCLPNRFLLGGIFQSISVTLSIATVFSAACGLFAPARLYKAYVIKWLSWFIANSVAAFLAFGLLWATAIACIFGVSNCLSSGIVLMLIVLPFPIFRLYVHVRDDLRTIRHGVILR